MVAAKKEATKTKVPIGYMESFIVATRTWLTLRNIWVTKSTAMFYSL